MSDTVVLKKVKPGVTDKGEYYTDKTLGSFKIVKGLTKEQKEKSIIIETLPTLVRGTPSVGL